MVVAMIQPARLQATHGRRWWRCPECGRTLAEVCQATLIIKCNGRELFAQIDHAKQKCPKCGVWSELTDDMVRSAA